MYYYVKWNVGISVVGDHILGKPWTVCANEFEGPTPPLLVPCVRNVFGLCLWDVEEVTNRNRDATEKQQDGITAHIWMDARVLLLTTRTQQHRGASKKMDATRKCIEHCPYILAVRTSKHIQHHVIQSCRDRAIPPQHHRTWHCQAAASQEETSYIPINPNRRAPPIPDQRSCMCVILANICVCALLYKGDVFLRLFSESSREFQKHTADMTKARRDAYAPRIHIMMTWKNKFLRETGRRAGKNSQTEANTSTCSTTAN